MSCPECGENDHQIWEEANPGGRHEPPEAAGYRCAYCGEVYEGDPGDEIDAAADSMNEYYQEMGISTH